jgi:cellobiose dehydrogenase (acceptor)
MKNGTYTDAATNITFSTWSAPLHKDGTGAYTFGVALPADAATANATEYVGYLKCESQSPPYLSGWCGISHGGSMINNLLLMAWPNEGRVWTSFRLTPEEYVLPPPYNKTDGPAPKISELGSKIGDKSFELIYRCENCLKNVFTADPESVWLLGYAIARETPRNAACPSDLRFGYHNNGFGLWAVQDVKAVSTTNYPKYAAMPAKAPPKETCVSLPPDPTPTAFPGGEGGGEGESEGEIEE